METTSKPEVPEVQKPKFALEPEGTLTDFHVHITDHFDIQTRKGRRFYGLANNHRNPVQRLLERCLSKNEDTLIAIADFDDNRAQVALDDIARQATENKYSVVVQSNLVSLSDRRRKATFITAQEIRTDKGDILIVGNSNPIRSRCLRNVIDEAKRQEALVFAVNVGYLRIGLKEESISELKGAFDGLEVWDQAITPEIYQSRKVIACHYEIPEYASSDSHTPERALTSATYLRNLDLTNRIGLNETIRAELKRINTNGEIKKAHMIHGSASTRESIRHISSVAIATLGLATGIFSRNPDMRNY